MAENSTRRLFMATAAAGIGLVARARASAPEEQRTTASTGTTDAQLVKELVAANRVLAQQGIVDTFGHVSVRLNRDPQHYLMSRSLAAEFVTADDIMEFDLDSNPVGPGGRSHGERFIHGEMHRASPTSARSCTPIRRR
jgi:HCOMODA/2-hydroxy-3-carboxy-muconic semialdehyde decarboxylase